MTTSLTAVALLTLCTAFSVTRIDAESKVLAPPGTQTGLPFSPAIVAGDFIYLSGAIGNLPGTLETPGGIEQQTAQTLDNIASLLASAKSGLDRVVSSNVYLADIRHFRQMNGVYGEHLHSSPRPVRATVEADIALRDALVEIEMIAAAPGVTVKEVTPPGWIRPVSPYSWALIAGDTLFVSGLVARDPISGERVGDDIAAQTERVLLSLKTILSAADLNPENVVSCRVFLADSRDFAAMNVEFEKFFPSPRPTRATVRARLANPAFLVEIQCTAVRSADRQILTLDGRSADGLSFSPAIRVGDRVFLSGALGRDQSGFGAGIGQQTRLTLARLRALLEVAGADFSDVVASAVFLSDSRSYAAMNQVYADIIGEPPPARATVGSQLMSSSALVEIAMTAVLTPAPNTAED